MQQYLIIIEKGENNYSAYAPDLPGCVAAGDTQEEVEQLMKEAIEFHIQGMIEDGIPVPQPASSASMVKVQAG